MILSKVNGILSRWWFCDSLWRCLFVFFFFSSYFVEMNYCDCITNEKTFSLLLFHSFYLLKQFALVSGLCISLARTFKWNEINVFELSQKLNDKEIWFGIDSFYRSVSRLNETDGWLWRMYVREAIKIIICVQHSLMWEYFWMFFFSYFVCLDKLLLWMEAETHIFSTLSVCGWFLQQKGTKKKKKKETFLMSSNYIWRKR